MRCESASGSSASASGPGMSTIPAPPPKGASSTDLWVPSPNRRRSWISTATAPDSIALATRLVPRGPSKNSGKIEITLMCTRRDYARPALEE